MSRSMDIENASYEHKGKEMENQAFEIIYGDEKTLLLDLDTDLSKHTYWSYYGVFAKKFKFTSRHEWNSKSGNLHVLIRLQEGLPMYDRLLIQSMLGSDPFAVLASLDRYRNFVEKDPCRLFKPKTQEAATTVVAHGSTSFALAKKR